MLRADAEAHGNCFVRIASIAEDSKGQLRSLDLAEVETRRVVREFTGGQVAALYDHDVARPYAS